MHWQDFVFTIGALFFIVALVYSVRSEDKPPTKTSVITGFWLGVFSVVSDDQSRLLCRLRSY
jgi:hypothetical protein